MDNMAIAHFRPMSNLTYSMVCVETFGDKLQLTIRAYHLGISVIFPAMAKHELVDRWMDQGLSTLASETDLLFDTAFLRLKPDYLLPEEVVYFRKAWIELRSVLSL
ncbi:hypothetical protein [Paenibacillus sp. 2TAB26]|uniref:hypothetical protein n=1 Tax=Paenibacillus sp. 2TAB26 TaxID=3233005 RepID=UPI003F976972